jgi:Multicopper oxidase
VSFDSTDFRNVVPRLTPENRKANQAFVDWLATYAERKNAGGCRIAYGINGAEYVWHCHILEHEEHDMMHALVIV